jgi:hypothetical protein
MPSTNEPGGPKPMEHDSEGIQNWYDDPDRHVKRPLAPDPKDVQEEAKQRLRKYTEKSKR